MGLEIYIGIHCALFFGGATFLLAREYPNGKIKITIDGTTLRIITIVSASITILCLLWLFKLLGIV